MITALLRTHIDQALRKSQFDVVPYVIERPSNLIHGDWSTNVPLQLAKYARGKLKQSPAEIAKMIVSHLGEIPCVERVEIAGPGFVNFFLSTKWINQVLNYIKNDSWDDLDGWKDVGKGKKVVIEYVSANPTGPLHIGNARSGPIGDTLARVLEATGFTVAREYYVNDIGGQVDRLGQSLLALGFPERSAASRRVEELEYSGSFYETLAQRIRKELEEEKGQDTAELPENEEFTKQLTQKAIEDNLASIAKDCQDLRCSFDLWQKESEIARSKTAAAIADLKNKGQTIERDGALWLKGREEDRDSVLVKADGSYTYFANDIAYHVDKFGRGHDEAINVWGSNHHGHVSRMQAALTALGIGGDRFRVILYQFVRVKRSGEVVRMSKRLGTFITAREVLDEVGADAMRFFLLRQNPTTHLDFDLELATLCSERNPVYAVQYAHARICSILRKIPNSKSQDANEFILDHPSEVALIKKLLEFPELMYEISHTYSVHLLTYYATDIATLFHQFYEQKRVISEDEAQMKSRLKLVRATKEVLSKTLDCLGVSAPERMERT